MKIAVIGAGAMGSVIGGLLAKAGNEVALIDVARDAIDNINAKGLRLDDKSGLSQTIRVSATDNPSEVGIAELVLVFVKCYQTEAAVRNALPIIGPETAVLSLQNGWGNGPRIASIVGKEKLLVGVCYHSATVLGPGHVLHAGKGMTFIGELDGVITDRIKRVTRTFNNADIEVTATENVIKEIWSKLALNVATLPTQSAIRLTADRLLDTPEMQSLMRGLLREVVAVAQAQKIELEYEERWNAIAGLLGKLAPNTKGSMLQDVENKRRTEIDVINGAIVEAGQTVGIPTPYNNAMVCLIKALEASFVAKP
jgi:2-dehydropantoate 2-reductase